MTQETFSRLLKGGQLATVEANKGRFRSFLYACAQHESSHFLERSAAEKRGANRVSFFDISQVEQYGGLLPITEPPREQTFDRAWSKIIVSRALAKLEADYHRVGKDAICKALIPLLNSGTERGGHRSIADALGLSEGNARITWLRFKTSFISHVRAEVVETIADPADVDAELRHLMSAWLSSAS